MAGKARPTLGSGGPLLAQLPEHGARVRLLEQRFDGERSLLQLR
jgi:hypothetical protein